MNGTMQERWVPPWTTPRSRQTASYSSTIHPIASPSRPCILCALCVSAVALPSPIARIAGGPTAVDHENMAVDVARLRRDQEEHGGGDLLRLPRPAERDVREQARRLFGISAAGTVE